MQLTKNAEINLFNKMHMAGQLALSDSGHLSKIKEEKPNNPNNYYQPFPQNRDKNIL